MESTGKEHIEGMEKGVADARVADYGELSSGKESDSDNDVDLGPPSPSEVQDDDEDHDAAIRAMEAVLRKARRKVLKYKPKGSSGAKKNPRKQVKQPSSEKAEEVQQTQTLKNKDKKGGRAVPSKRWTNNDTSILIDMLEERSCLWDVNAKDYKSKDKRAKALEEIEDVIGIPPNEIKTKIVSLRAQLGRELAKVSKVRSGQSTDELYKSTWVYWERLQFLRPALTPRKSIDCLTMTADDENQGVQPEIFSNVEDSSSSSSLSQSTPRINTKRSTEAKKQELLTNCINVLKQPISKPNEKEECHFASYIAQKLALFDKRTRAIAEKQITDVIFDLEINGYYNTSNENIQGNFGGFMMQNNQGGSFMNMIQQ